MTSIFQLVGSVLVDTSEANKSLDKTKSNAEGLGGKFLDGAGKAAKWAAGVATAAVAVGGAMVAAAKKTATSLDEVDKASQRMKVSAEAYQELAYAADLSGVSMSTLEKAAKKLEGTGLNMEDAMNQVMGISDETERANKAIELFGETVAYQMTPLLNAGADGFEAMKQEANDLGLVMSQETVTSGAALNDMFSKVEKSLSALGNQLMTEFMPYIMQILDWLIANIPMIMDTIKGVLDWLMPYIQPIITGVMDFIKGIFALINGDLDTFVEGIKSLFKNLGSSLFNLGKEIFTKLWDGLKSVWTSISSWISEKVSWLVDKLAFWRKGKEETGGGDPDGTHASGLPYVPFDGYNAVLHKGETVVNAGDTKSMAEDIINGIKGALNGPQSPIEVVMNLDGAEFARLMYDYNQSEGRRRGSSLIMA